MLRAFSITIASIVFCMGTGCGGTAVCTISGQVRVDGKPVEKGVISFSPESGPGDPVTGNIENGTYRVRSVAGPKRVQISAPILVGKQPDSNAPDAAIIEITKESLPAIYNSASNIRFDPSPGLNTKDWDLTKKSR